MLFGLLLFLLHVCSTASGRRVFIYPDWWTNMPEPVVIDGYEYNAIWIDGVHLNESMIWSLYHCAHRKGFNITIVDRDFPVVDWRYYHKVLWNSRNISVDTNRCIENQDIGRDAIEACYEECQVPDTFHVDVDPGTLLNYLALYMPRSWIDCSSDETTGSRADMYYDETTTEEEESDDQSPPPSSPRQDRSTFLAEISRPTESISLPSLGRSSMMLPITTQGGSSRQ